MTFNKAKTLFHRIGNAEVYLREGTIANGQRYLNWSKKVLPGQVKESFGVLDKVQGKDYFADIYSFIIRRIKNFSKNGHVRTEVQKVAQSGQSTLTVMEDGIRSFKFVYDTDGTHLKTIFYDNKGLKAREIEVR
ncbi:hypothetical protein IKL64_01405 [bacterium]|nr:hypothetical protein [bacterium]